MRWYMCDNDIRRMHQFRDLLSHNGNGKSKAIIVKLMRVRDAVYKHAVELDLSHGFNRIDIHGTPMKREITLRPDTVDKIAL